MCRTLSPHRPKAECFDVALLPQDYLGLVKAEVRAENEMVEEFVREQMGISAIAEARQEHASTWMHA